MVKVKVQQVPSDRMIVIQMKEGEKRAKVLIKIVMKVMSLAVPVIVRKVWSVGLTDNKRR